jgi:hypothetical protein
MPSCLFKCVFFVGVELKIQELNVIFCFQLPADWNYDCTVEAVESNFHCSNRKAHFRPTSHGQLANVCGGILPTFRVTEQKFPKEMWYYLKFKHLPCNRLYCLWANPYNVPCIRRLQKLHVLKLLIKFMKFTVIAKVYYTTSGNCAFNFSVFVHFTCM